ncbi:MAG TPA: glycosyltransferase [Polyangiaceae bacterium]|nr:glycosyltransferase [Polyangiaceae bacterium]
MDAEPPRRRRVSKVLDVTEFWSERGGGVRTYLTNKAQTLTSLGIDHCVLVSARKTGEGRVLSNGAAGSRLVELGGPPLPYDSTYRLFLRLSAARRRMQSERPDVLEIHSPELAAVAALRVPESSYGIRTFVWHSDFIDTYLSWRVAEAAGQRAADLVTTPLWSWVHAIANRCAATIAASRYQATKLRDRGIPRVAEVPFGVDTNVFHPGAADPAYRAEHLGDDRDALLLVGSGRFAGEKRWDVVIDGFRRLSLRRRAKFVLFGDGPERARLEARARGIPNLVFAGFTKDRAALARALASSDALVHSGPFETFGLAVAEAVACGTPVVVADRGAAHELADPRCGEVYTALDPESLANAVERLFTRDRSELVAAARDRARRAISIDSHFRSMVALYEDLLAEHSERAAVANGP